MIKKRLIYVYEFPDKSVYVGLTYDPKKRTYQHFNSKHSAVYQWIKKSKLTPIYKELTNYLDPKVAAKKEGYFKNLYKKRGWRILNKYETGGLGGAPFRWSLKNCKLDAKKYRTSSEWKSKSNSAYTVAAMKGWLNQCCQHMTKLYKPDWTLKGCKRDAKKYRTKCEWKRKSSGAYQAARKNGWLNQCCQHMIELLKPKRYWNKENCISDAKKYDFRSQWKRKSGGAYKVAYENGWLEECCKHMKRPKNIKWTLKLCKKDAKKYRTRKNWAVKSTGYDAAHRNGWLEECCKHMIIIRRPMKYWNKKRCKRDGNKYRTRLDWQINSNGAYNSARLNGWLDQIKMAV